MKSKNVDLERWKVRQIDYKRKQKDIWIHWEVFLFSNLGALWLILIAMTASQTRIAETIDAFYGEAGTRDNVSAYYRQAVEDLDAETVKELVPYLPPNWV